MKHPASQVIIAADGYPPAMRTFSPAPECRSDCSAAVAAQKHLLPEMAA